ncbi:MAG: hypothetical protein KDD39_14750 [Bdellovibrionales bacterium]|nr:hypothetical protein [Bdellovibrionales bacterium]
MAEVSKKQLTLEDVAPHSHDEIAELLAPSDSFSVYEDYGDFKILIVRKMTLEKQSLSFVSDFFLLKANSVFFYDREYGTFKKFTKGYEQLLRVLERAYFGNQRIVTGYADQIEKLEDDLFNRSIPGYFLDMWFDLKKDLSRVENYCSRNLVVFKEFLKKSDSLIKDLKDEYKDIEEGIQFQANNALTLSNRLDSLHNYYDSIKGDRLNKTILALTVISGIFLPLNLIVGFFGMNTDGLYFHGDPQGTEKVLIVLAVVLITCLLGLRIAKAIDHYILQFLLGRYDFYKNISNRLNELDQRLKGKV